MAGMLLTGVIVIFIFMVNSINMKKNQFKNCTLVLRSALRKRFTLFIALRQLPEMAETAEDAAFSDFAALAEMDFLESRSEADELWKKISVKIPENISLGVEIAANEACIARAEESAAEAAESYNSMIAVQPWKFFAVLLRMKPVSF